ncbi:MAG: hypothetical protein JWN24_1653 [Phycisphaerales bacterium]|jgi:hypothetical protein|nr:hypothetical protein [Phycisphaerales bacterium]
MTGLLNLTGKASFAFAIASGLLMSAGCNAKLEDGYEPHALGASPDIRRSYYASPFTEQAEPRAAQDQGTGVRKPGL